MDIENLWKYILYAFGVLFVVLIIIPAMADGSLLAIKVVFGAIGSVVGFILAIALAAGILVALIYFLIKKFF